MPGDFFSYLPNSLMMGGYLGMFISNVSPTKASLPGASVKTAGRLSLIKLDTVSLVEIRYLKSDQILSSYRIFRDGRRIF